MASEYDSYVRVEWEMFVADASRARETFQTTRLLRRELSRRGLEIRRELRDSNPRTPSFLIVKS